MQFAGEKRALVRLMLTPATETSYSMTLTTKKVTLESGATVTYFDKTKATRQ
jgi:hypothetical protein